MQQIGVRDLKAKVSEVLRHVTEDKETYEITNRGKVVARIVPSSEPLTPDEIMAGWDKLVAEVAKYDLGDPRSSVEILDEERGRLC